MNLTINNATLIPIHHDDSPGLDRLIAALNIVGRVVFREMPVVLDKCTHIVYEAQPIPGDRLAQGACIPTSDGASYLRFRSDQLQHMDDAVLQNLIAHELRHSWQFAEDFAERIPSDEILRQAALNEAAEFDACHYADTRFKRNTLYIPPECEQLRVLQRGWHQLNADSKRAIVEFYLAERQAWHIELATMLSDPRLRDILEKWSQATEDERERIFLTIMV